MPDLQNQARKAGFILAGGESSRMGRDKALLRLRGVPLILRTARLVESALHHPPTIIGPSQPYRNLGWRVVEDDWPGAGPLGGIATALRVSTADWNLVVACGLPYLTGPWLDFLVARAGKSHCDAVLPMNIAGAEPLCAMYHKRCGAAIRAALKSDVRKVTAGLARLRIQAIAPAEWKPFDSDGFLFRNMNSPADYEEAKRRLG
jgi:molybdopterin-guanine dinucleotide biosynthesis protein A